MGQTANNTGRVNPEKLRSQVEGNYEAFTTRLNEFIPSHVNRYALMRNGEIVEFYNTYTDAWRTGNKFFEDGLFSIQKVTRTPVDLGFYSRA